MRAAYDALDPATRERVQGMSAFHSLYYSQARIGIDPSVTASANARLVGQTAVHEAVVAHAPQRPLVKVHPVTGRPALFVGRHAYGIPGLDPADSTELLDALIDEACRPPRVHSHRWRPGDIAVWDNRCVLHRARPYEPTEARSMVHTASTATRRRSTPRWCRHRRSDGRHRAAPTPCGPGLIRTACRVTRTPPVPRRRRGGPCRVAPGWTG